MRPLDNVFLKRVGISILVLIVLFTFYQIAYPIYVKNSSEPVYTIAYAFAKYSSSKDYGKTMKYYVSGKEYFDNCVSRDCKGIEVGTGLVIKYWPKDPSVIEYIEGYMVSKFIDCPEGGWSSLKSLKTGIISN